MKSYLKIGLISVGAVISLLLLPSRVSAIQACYCDNPSPVCEEASDSSGCRSGCTWMTTADNCSATRNAAVSSGPTRTGLIARAIPSCLFQADIPTQCKNVDIFIEFAINIGDAVFGVIGALALVFFIYGGFTLILSAGRSDKVKKGGEIMVAAVVGLIISFSAFMLIRFLAQAIGVSSYYKL